MSTQSATVEPSVQVAQAGKVDAIGDLRGLVRIAKATSVGVTGNGPRIERAEKAIEAVAKLIAAINVAGRFLEETATCQSEPIAKITRHNVQLLRAALSAIRSEK